jgi:CRISPR-associated protein Cas2
VDDTKRLKLAKLLQDYGRRVQKSVFECLIDDRRFLVLKQEIEKIIDLEADSVRYYILCQRCVSNIEVSGWGTVSEDPDIIIV